MKPIIISIQREQTFSKETIASATHYAYGALNSQILCHHYKKLAKTKSKAGILEAAMEDFLNNELMIRRRKKPSNPIERTMNDNEGDQLSRFLSKKIA